MNRLRNFAFNFDTKSKYVFLNDVDFVPSLNLKEQIKRHVKEKVINKNQVTLLSIYYPNIIGDY